MTLSRITEMSDRRRIETILHIVLSFNSIALVSREEKRAQTSVHSLQRRHYDIDMTYSHRLIVVGLIHLWKDRSRAYKRYMWVDIMNLYATSLRSTSPCLCSAL